MPIDDPGWGDYTPPPGGQQQGPQQPQPQTPTQQQPQTPAPAGGPPASNAFADPKVRMVLAGIVLAALAAVAFFMLSGDDSKDSGDKQPAAAVGGDVEEEGLDDAEGIGTLPLADYTELANQVCSAYAGDIQAAQQSNDLQALAQVDQAMLDELQQLPPPDQSADLVQSLYSDFQQAIDALGAGDVQTAQGYAQTAQSTAVQLGFDACVAT